MEDPRSYSSWGHKESGTRLSDFTLQLLHKSRNMLEKSQKDVESKFKSFLCGNTTNKKLRDLDPNS